METSGTPPVRAAMVQGEDGTWQPLTGGAAGPTTYGAPQKIGLMAVNADGQWAPWTGGTPPTGPDGEPIEPGDFDARYVNKTGDTMTGGLSFGTAISSATDVSKHISFERNDSTNQGDMSKGVYLYAGNDKIGINVSSKRLNLVCNYGDDAIDGLIGGAVRSRTHAGGLWVPDGHSVDTPKISRANIEYDATSADGVHTFEVAGNRIVEIENSGIHIHGDGAVDTPNLIIKDQDSDERYLLRSEYVPPVGSVSSATVGDVKSAFLAADHSGWILLDGRTITGLTATQQVAATGLGFAANLPNAGGVVLMQGGALGAVAGSNSRTLTQANLPNVSLTSDEQGLHRHTMRSVENDNGKQNLQNLFMGKYDNNEQLWNGGMDGATLNNKNYPQIGAAMEGAGAHTHSVPLGGLATPLDITPKSLCINMFVYLGA